MASTTTQWILELVDKLTAPLRSATDTAQKMTDTVERTTEEVDKLGKQATESASRLEKFGKGIFFMNEIKDGIDNVTGAFDNAIEPGIAFQTSVADLSGITKTTGEDLKVLSDMARETAVSFGTKASDSVDLYTSLLSKLDPKLKAAPESLKIMSENVLTLSKTMRGDVPGATSAMTAALNQFQVMMDDPIQAAKTMTEYMNIMAAGAVEGSAVVPKVAAALEIVGFQAKSAGISFAETNAAIQMLDKLGKTGSEGGTILRNIISRLQVQTESANKQLLLAGVNIKKMHDETIPLTERLRTLIPVMNNAEIMQAIFGEEARASATALLANADKVDEWTQAIQGTNSAVEMASIQLDTYAEKQRRMQAWIDDLKISFFEFTEPFAPIIEVVGIATTALVTLGMVAFSVTNIMQVGMLKTSATWVASMTKMAISAVASSKIITASIYGIPIIGWVAAAIAAITALMAFLWNKFEGFREFLFGVWEFVKSFFVGFYKFLWNIAKSIWEVLNPANWFDDSFSFQGVWDNLVKETEENAKRVGEAWERGKAKGRESWANRNGEKKTELPILNEQKQMKLNPQPGNGTQNNTGGTGGNGSVGLGGSGKGNGGVRNITMNVTMNNSFTVSGEGDYRKIVERVKRDLIAVLSDVSPAIG